MVKKLFQNLKYCAIIWYNEKFIKVKLNFICIKNRQNIRKLKHLKLNDLFFFSCVKLIIINNCLN